jgi:site-specific DNA recombinase
MSQDPHDQLLLQIRGAVAEYERTLITERMRRGRQRKLEAGLMLPWTRAPFGYRVDPDRPRDPAGVRVEEAEAAIVREMFAWYADETHSFCSLARLLEQRGIRTSTGLARWNLASIRDLLTNPAYAGQVYGNRWHHHGTLERRSATAPRKRSTMSRVAVPREEWILVAEIPPLVSQEQFDRVQARLASNRRFARRNNKAHPYLLRGLVSCGVCGLACLARANMHRYRYYSCTGKLPALFSHREQKCPSRLSPAERLDELVWADLCDLLSHPEQASHALARAHGGQWLPQALQARQQGLRRGQVSLGQQLERLTEAYLGGVVLLDEYRRRRRDLEERQRQLEEQARQLEAQADRHKELSGAIEDFCQRVRQGLAQATFEQRRTLVELLIDRVIVTDGEVEIRYVMPTDRASEQVRFCHLRLDYLQSVVFIGAGAMDNAPAERRADRPRVGAVAVRGDLVGGHARDRLGRAEEGLGCRHVAVLAQHGVHEVTVAVDGPVQVAPPAAYLQVGLVHMPLAAAGATLTMPPTAEFVGQQRRELGLPLADGFVAEDNATLEEHLAQVAQGQAVAQAPQHHERDDIRGVLGPVQQAGTALVELLATVPAAEPTIALGSALRPLRHRRRAAVHAIHPGPPPPPGPEPTSGALSGKSPDWHEA